MVQHDDHNDYLHNGHLHFVMGNSIEHHRLEVSAVNPDACSPETRCPEHTDGHHHGEGCGHEAVPHGDHLDYLVDGRLHHEHRGHCDDHGPLLLA
jgi:hypothetical protein